MVRSPWADGGEQFGAFTRRLNTVTVELIAEPNIRIQASRVFVEVEKGG
jgi:hypothetical protein